MVISIKKGVVIGVFGGLTIISALGCKWQFRRYQESSFRWGRLRKAMDDGLASPLSAIIDNM